MHSVIAVIRTVVLVALFALATTMVGWWAVPALALVWGLVAGRFMRRPAAAAAVSAALAWGVLLATDAAGGRLGILGGLFGSIARVPAPVFFALTLGFPALLGWSAAALGAGVWPRRAARRHYVPAAHVLDDDRRTAVRG